jgi:hypothetical protein
VGAQARVAPVLLVAARAPEPTPRDPSHDPSAVGAELESGAPEVREADREPGEDEDDDDRRDDASTHPTGPWRGPLSGVGGLPGGQVKGEPRPGGRPVIEQDGPEGG